MAIDYFLESEKFRPKEIKKLLIGEAPPASGKTYFYVPKPMNTSIPIREDRSLPATILHHYFRQRPADVETYIQLLKCLQKMGIFLIDICDDPITVRRNPEGLERIIEEIPKLRGKMADREIHVPESNVIFLLARNNYRKHIRREFPQARTICWIDFRMTPELVDVRLDPAE